MTALLRKISDKYYWLTALMIAQNAITRQYKNSFLGLTWSVLQPLVQVLIFAIVMPLIMRFPVENYVLYLIISYPLWSFIATTIIRASDSIINQAETLKRCVVSATVFPIADVFKNLYSYLIGFATMYFFALLFITKLNPVVLLFPVYLLPVVISVIAISVAISFVAPYIRDIGELTVLGMNAIFWMTPVIYPLAVVPESVQYIFWLNPFFLMMHPLQEIIYNQAVPSVQATLNLLMLTLASLIISYAIYRRCRRNYVYYL